MIKFTLEIYEQRIPYCHTKTSEGVSKVKVMCDDSLCKVKDHCGFYNETVFLLQRS